MIGSIEKVGFFHKIYLYFIVICIVIILINSGIIYYETKDLNKSISYIGKKLLYPTINLDNLSKQIIDKNIGKIDIIIIKDYFLLFLDLITTLFIILMWLKVLAFLFLNVILMNNNMVAVAYLLAIFVFFVVQMLLLSINGQSILAPFNSFINLFKAFYSLTGGPVNSIVDKVLPDYELGNSTNININLSLK